MKKIIGLVLALVLLTSVFAVLPASAEGDATITEVAVHLDQGITLVYKLSDGSYEYVPVAAKEMNKVAAPAGYTEGVTSVKAYAEDLRNKTDDEITVALVDAMLNYGAAAQNYFDYETDKLVGTPVTDTTALKGAAAPEVEINDEDGIYLGATLVLEGTLKLRFYFKGTGLQAFYNENEQSAYGENVEKNFCYFDENVMPYDIFEPVTITVGTTTVSYAPINYLKAKANDTDEKLTAMVASIYDYCVAARAYYLEYNCTHKGITLKATTVPTIFTEGLASGICPDCGDSVTEVLPVNTPTVTKVDYVLKAGETNKINEAPVVRESMQLSEALGEGEHFYPTNANPEGKSLYIEFSMLLNETMNNFVNSNISFPGIYTSTWLDSAYGNSAFWFYIKAADGIAQGGYDDWTSNAVDGADYYNAKPVLAMDGWHRFGFEFHQNTTINGDDVSYTMDVTMYIDGVKVYEATLGKKVEDTKNILLYTAEVVDGETIYTDRADAYAAFFRYTMYVSDAANPAYLVYADQYMGTDGFAVSVSPVENPTVGTFEVEEGKTVTAKQYFKVQGQSDCDLGNHSWAEVATVDKAATCTEDGQKSIKCTVCKTVKEGTVEVITAAHTWGASTVDTPATCTTDGQKSIKCTTCGDVKDGSVVVIPASHTWGASTVDTPATCTTAGQESIKCSVCNAVKDGSVKVIPITGHAGLNTVVVPTVFSDGLRTGTCTACNQQIDEVLKKTTANFTKVTVTGAGKQFLKESERLGDVLEDGQHFYPTEDNPDGNSLYVEFSMLLNSSMDKLQISNITFPGIYSDSQLKTGTGAFWFFLRDGDAVKGKCDDWGSNAFKELGYVNNQTALAFDGWHRIGVEFHQNTNIDYENKTISYSMTVKMYYDGVQVYEATLGKNNSTSLRLYTAEFDGDEVVYTDLVDSYASYYSYDAYVKNSADPAYFVTADMYMTCGNDGFVLDVSPVTDPEAEDFTQNGVTLSGKQYFKLDSSNCDYGYHNWATEATVTVPATCTTDGEKSVKCTVCNTDKPGTVEVIVSAGQHVLDDTAVITVIPTVFADGIKAGTCTVCNEDVEVAIKSTANFTKVNVTGAGKQYLKESERLGDVLEDGQHFHPTEDNPDGNSLYIEFSILLNSSMDKLGINQKGEAKGTNITFPGIYSDSQLKTGTGAFWFFLRDGDAVKGKCDDWGSNAFKELGYVNNQTALAFDGWHRIGVEFHQNTNIDYENKTISYSMTVKMYYDGVQVYEATLGKNNSTSLRLYTAEFDGDEVVYTDLVDSYASYYSYDAYVKNSADPAYFVTADMYMTCGNDGFVLDVSPVTNPEAENFTQDGVTLSGKQYFTVNN